MRRSTEDQAREIILDPLVDYTPRDSTDMMPRPFFSLSKRKRLKPIEYKSPDGKVEIKVTANPLYGMATIWDADILIWLISKIVARRNSGSNDTSPIVHTTVHELLKGIGRAAGGTNYREIMASINRLRHTQVETSIRANGKRYAAFHYLGDMDGLGSEDSAELSSLSLRVPEWLLQGIEAGQYITIDRTYYKLTGGVERAIYRAARKHAGNQPQGWKCSVEVLHQKTGSEAALRKFAYAVREIVAEDALPRYAMTMCTTKEGKEAVHFVDREFLSVAEQNAQATRRLARHREHARTAWIDAGRRPAEFDQAWSEWLAKGFATDEFADSLSENQARLV